MLNKGYLALTLPLFLLAIEPAFSSTLDELNTKMRQDQAQYMQDQAATTPTRQKIQELNKQIMQIEQPFQAKYQGLDQKLQQVSKPYQDKINELMGQLRQAEEPYRNQIKERDEEQKRIDRETRPLRDQIRTLNDSDWKARKVVEEDARRLESDRAAMQEFTRTNLINMQAKPSAPQKPKTVQPAQ